MKPGSIQRERFRGVWNGRVTPIRIRQLTSQALGEASVVSSSNTLGRHRAASVGVNPLTAISKAVSSNAGSVGRQAAVIAAASGLALTGGIATVAHAPTTERVTGPASEVNVSSGNVPEIKADSTLKVSFAKSEVSSSPAPVAPKPVVQVQASPAAVGAAPAAASKPTAEGGVGAKVAAAAYAQLGVRQDCTALVSNSLSAAGIAFHGWPAGYLSLGRTVSAAEAQPGDLVYYADGGMGTPHIGVYVGNGMAVHGGWNGNNTVLFSANVGSGPVFIAIGH